MMSVGSAEELQRHASLVRLAADGDTSAFTAIVEAHASDMARVSFAICGDAEMARDAVQSAWTVAWRKLDSLRDESRLRSWLLVLAANEARRLARRHRLRGILERVAGGERNVEPAPNVEHLDLADAVRTLPRRDRHLLGLRYGAGLTSAEIGAQIGLSASGVRVRLARILDHLRRELTDA